MAVWASPLMADFRVACPEARFAANFARLGFHQGFGLTVTLPALVGQQKALDLLYTGRRVNGEEAVQIGLCDRLVPRIAAGRGARLRPGDRPFRPAGGPLDPRRRCAVDLAEEVQAATDHELERAGPAAQDRGLQGRRPGHGGASPARFQGSLSGTCRARGPGGSDAVPPVSETDGRGPVSPAGYFLRRP